MKTQLGSGVAGAPVSGGVRIQLAGGARGPTAGVGVRIQLGGGEVPLFIEA